MLVMREVRAIYHQGVYAVAAALRDLRMLKMKQKVSGCFRTERGAEEFCRLRGYVSTMKKQGRGVTETIKSLFTGKVLMPALRC